MYENCRQFWFSAYTRIAVARTEQLSRGTQISRVWQQLCASVPGLRTCESAEVCTAVC
jgi:hypothetical protein